MLSLIAIFTSAFFMVSALILIMRPLALEVGLVDKPCSRKKHVGEIPLIGGLAIYVGITVCSFMITPFDVNYRIFLLSTSFMVLIGALDDFHDINAKVRLIAQLLIASLMVFGANLYIDNLGALFSESPVSLGPFGPLFTVIAVVACINAFNMIDGLDGLVGLLSVTTFSGIGILAVMNGIQLHAQFMTLLIGAIFAFLFFNFGVFRNGKYKVFMGDAGSMLIGLTVIWLLTFLTQESQATIKPVTALWLIAVPLMDMLSVTTRRIIRGQSPMQASRDHIHHLLGQKFSSHKSTVTCIFAISMVFMFMGVFGELYNVDDLVMLVFYISSFLLFHGVMIVLERKEELVVGNA